MALQKEITTRFNYPATYWRIIDLTTSWITKTARIRIVGYKDKDTRIAPAYSFIEERIVGVKPIEFDMYFNSEELTQEGVNPLVAAYKYIKEKVPEFAGAIDLAIPNDCLIEAKPAQHEEL